MVCPSAEVSGWQMTKSSGSSPGTSSRSEMRAQSLGPDLLTTGEAYV